MAKESKKKNADEKVEKEETKAKAAEAEKTEETEQKAEPSKEAELQKKLDETNDRLLRVAAEYDNFRKRSQREKDALYGDCKAAVIKDLLPVADNFDRIFANPEAGFDDYKKGIEMTYKQFGEILKKLGVEFFGEVGEEFDPNIHNAVMHTEDDTVSENTITNVLVKGYKLGDKIIRPAMVAVAN